MPDQQIPWTQRQAAVANILASYLSLSWDLLFQIFVLQMGSTHRQTDVRIWLGQPSLTWSEMPEWYVCLLSSQFPLGSGYANCGIALAIRILVLVTRVVLEYGAIYNIAQICIHIDGHLIAFAHKQIHKVGAFPARHRQFQHIYIYILCVQLLFRYVFQEAHQQRRQTQAPVVGRDSQRSHMSVPIVHMSLNLAHDCEGKLVYGIAFRFSQYLL